MGSFLTQKNYEGTEIKARLKSGTNVIDYLNYKKKECYPEIRRFRYTVFSCGRQYCMDVNQNKINFLFSREKY